ncbi:MAG: META domain-containing protein, partial [Paraprevotella sp.]|nr:META domain-containing protein [Paraprevotella sp.]
MSAAFMGIIMTGCKSSKNALDAVALNGDWNITTVNGEVANGEKQPFLSLNIQDKHIYGCAGCNRINGEI